MSANFRQFWGFFINTLRSQFRNPSAIFFSLFFPLIFIFSFAFFNNSSINFKLGIVPNSTKEYVIFKDTLFKSNIFKIQEGNKNELIKKLEKGELDGVVSYQSGSKIEVLTNSSRSQNNLVIIQTLNTVIDKITLGGRSPVLTISEKNIQGRSAKYIDFVLPGILGFSLLSAAVAGTSFSLVSLKNDLTLKRLFSTPAKSYLFILGKSTGHLVFNFLQSIILILLAIMFFGYQPRDGFFSFLQMLVVIILGLLIFLGMGYIVAGVAKNDEQVAPLTNIITVPQFLLTGTFFSVSSLPVWIQNIAKIMPLYNFNEAMRLISLDGQKIWSLEVSTQVGILIIWTIAVYFLASKVFSVKTV